MARTFHHCDKQSNTDTFKTASKNKQTKKTTEATTTTTTTETFKKLQKQLVIWLVIKLLIKLQKPQKKLPQNNLEIIESETEIPKERYISPEKGKEIIEDRGLT